MPTKNSKRSDRRPTAKRLDVMMRRLLQEPGVAEAVELYERAEGFYQNVAPEAAAQEYATNSTNG